MSDEAVVSGHPLANCFARELLVVSRGEGVWLEDRSGNRYLDFTGGIAVNALGYGREDLARVAYEQMKRLVHISNLYMTEPVLELSAKMVASGPFQAVQFLSSGSEANETALKYARLYAHRTRGEGHHRLLCFSGGFHGRTMGVLSLTPTPKYQRPFEPLLPGVEVAPYNDPAALERVLDGTFAGVIVEVVQGEGGLARMSGDFAAALNRSCRQHDVILIADEVQTGLSRTGTLFASAAVGLEPDIVTLAKPLAAGLPLSAVLIPGKVNALVHPGEHGSTFGGGPVTTAVASRVWDILAEPSFQAAVRSKGEVLQQGLRELAGQYPFLGQVKGLGMLAGVEVLEEGLPPGRRGPEFMGGLLTELRHGGVLVLRSGENVLRIAPPLVISREELLQGLTLVGNTFRRLAAEG